MEKTFVLNNQTQHCQSWHCGFIYGQILACIIILRASYQK